MVLSEKVWNELEDMRCRLDKEHKRISYEEYLKDFKDHPERHQDLFG